MDELSIQDAMLQKMRGNRAGGVTFPITIDWKGLAVQTADRLEVPERGLVVAQILKGPGSELHGFDINVSGGWLLLPNGSHVETLRTWDDKRLDSTVQYTFWAPQRHLSFWNVYKTILKNGITREDKWGGNAGFWIEATKDNDRIYHCSPGAAEVPDFESLVVKISIRSITGHEDSPKRPHPGRIRGRRE